MPEYVAWCDLCKRASSFGDGDDEHAGMQVEDLKREFLAISKSLTSEERLLGYLYCCGIFLTEEGEGKLLEVLEDDNIITKAMATCGKSKEIVKGVARNIVFWGYGWKSCEACTLRQGETHAMVAYLYDFWHRNMPVFSYHVSLHM